MPTVLSESVSFAESKYVRLGRWLSGFGFALAEPGEGARDEDGSISDGDQKRQFGYGLIIEVPKSGFLNKLLNRKRERCIASIWIKDSTCSPERRVGAKGGNWVVEVFGREHIDRITELSEKMASEFGVKVHVRLEREESKPARYYDTQF